MLIRSTFVVCTLFTVCALSVVGCGQAATRFPDAKSGGDQPTRVAALQQGQQAPERNHADDSIPPAPTDIPPSERKIIYHAKLRIDVTNFGEAANGVESLISQHGGFVASSQLGGHSGSTRSGRWTLRVPVAQYRTLVAALTHLGELREQRDTSEEVTAEFFDLEARVRNKQQEEQRLLAHLDETTRGLSEILTIEKELSRVRGEVERLQGRLKMLADQTSLSTIDLTLSETETFVTAESPTFVMRIQRTWDGSLEILIGVLQGFALFAIAVFPWIAALVILSLIPLTASFLLRRWETPSTR